jgi:hypothetical protein
MAAPPLQSVPAPVLAVFGLVGLGLVAIAAREAWLGLRYRARGPTPIGSLGDATGRVVVSGVARRVDDVVRAPVTGRDCLAYAWRVSDLRTVRSPGGEIRTERATVGRGRDSVAFLVEDDTGSVRVDPAGAEFRLAEEWVRDPADDPLDRADVLTGLDPLGSETRAREYFESRLDEGETVTVRGRVGPEEDLRAVRQVGVRITGGGTLVEDATPGAAAGRAFRRAAYAGVSGLAVLAILAVLLGVV